ncbi:MAG: ABC transporter ATP-binding protein [Clostridia bacterium]|nr:ABC transporter ATP-binding protein [Clostridia bacterium]
MAIAIQQLKEKRECFAQSELKKKEIFDTFANLNACVKATIDPLAISKDSLTYTFGTGVRSELESYFYGKKNNKREEAKYEKQLAKHNAIKAKGKTPNWTVAAPSLVNFELVQSNILNQIDRLIRHYEEIIANQADRNYHEEAIAVIDYLKACASGVVQKVTYNKAKNKALKLLEEVGISEPRKRFKQYPFEFSGGMRQRIVIAIALAANPDILICDEPTTALDVTIQSQILELINKLKKERNLTVIFITHDLGVVANMADRIAVMYAGKIVEYGTSEDVFYHSAHPYTWALLSSMPDLDTNEKLDAIPGTPPNMIYPPVGDAFAERNKYAMKIDFERQPPMFKISDTHYAATWLLHPNAPKIDTPKIITDRIARMKKMKEAQENGKQ